MLLMYVMVVLKSLVVKLTKYYYRALPSFNKYKSVLSEARQGINMTELEII